MHRSSLVDKEALRKEDSGFLVIPIQEGVKMDLSKTYMPEFHLDAHDCEHQLLVLALDPFGDVFPEDLNRSNNFVVIPSLRNCEPLYSEEEDEMDDSSCHVIPEFSSLGKSEYLSRNA